MKDALYIIKDNVRIAPGVWKMDLEGDTSSITRAGQFVDVQIEGFFLRRPLAVQKWDDGGFSMIYKVIGNGTEKLSSMVPGQSLRIMTGLGNGFDPESCAGSALVVCGGLGASPVFSLVKELKELGRTVTVIMGFNTAGDVFLEEEFRRMADNVIVTTVDGSKGIKGFVTDAMGSLDFDYFYACGPRVMMKAVCERTDRSGQVSLEERMGCGCGICYGCTCHTESGPKRVCKDGPVFKKEEVIW